MIRETGYDINVLKKGVALWQKNVWTKDEFFATPIIYKVAEDKIMFFKPSLDYQGQETNPTHIPCKRGKTTYTFSIICEQLTVGGHNFSEESTEDCKIIYF
jgi:hypothetical protein